MGGILADLRGRTTLPGLFAIGECASNGLHGANRLASNSLLEGGVMAMKVSRAILGDHCSDFASKKIGIALAPHLVPKDMECFRRTMYENVGLLRDRNCLNNLLENLTDNNLVSSSQDADSWSKANMLLVGSKMVAAALKREESRGSHCRSDYPERNDIAFAKRLAVCGEKWEWLGTGSFELPADRAPYSISLLSSPKIAKAHVSAG
jgi:aspartate oxidase